MVSPAFVPAIDVKKITASILPESAASTLATDLVNQVPLLG